ncbi:GTP cyclohydrolase [Pseudoalteromonas phenolica]|uniref:GTP cyclohydrolase n=1 Tax=Pseudoalteromonas phenolica TaxID=161398 RepID=A0A5R9Q609_9GAMM|nr:YciI family protein [Pseudoalteromonas phenolica]TLX48593.1 GTP cyclohydrolase [Pseudoalteromonas phenolica]
MFIVSLSYCAPLSVIDKYIPEHKTFLEKHYGNGNFILSGRKNPRTGGVIISTIKDRKQLDKVIAQDPFFIEALAHYEITEILPTMAAQPLAFLLQD